MKFIIYGILGILSITFILYIIFKENQIKKIKKNIENEVIQNFTNEKKMEIEKNVQDSFSKKRVELQALNNEITSKQEFNSHMLKMREEELDRILSITEENKKKQLDINLKKYEEDLKKSIDLAATAKNEEQVRKYQEYQHLLEEIKLELDSYKEKRDTINQAIIRDKEILESEFFYKINLTDEDKCDISILEGIRPKIKNQEALSKLIYDVYYKKPLNELIKRITNGRQVGGIYKITYIPTKESYIGRSVDISKRWKEHCLSSLSIGTIAHSSFHTFLNEKGIDSFTWEILEEVPKDKQSEREKYYIKFYGTDKFGLNMKVG